MSNRYTKATVAAFLGVCGIAFAVATQRGDAMLPLNIHGDIFDLKIYEGSGIRGDFMADRKSDHVTFMLQAARLSSDAEAMEKASDTSASSAPGKRVFTKQSFFTHRALGQHYYLSPANEHPRGSMQFIVVNGRDLYRGQIMNATKDGHGETIRHPITIADVKLLEDMLLDTIKRVADMDARRGIKP